jgi:hypothetical protein
MTKVFCKDCRYVGSSGLYCAHPSNLETITNFYESKLECKDSPSVINKNNNCKNYKYKGDM